MKNKKSLIAFLFCFMLIQVGFAQNQNENDTFVKIMIEQLKQNPIVNYRAAYWFAQLSVSEKKYFSEKLGRIVLNTNDSTEFVVAFGSEKSPYPWAFQISENNIKLSTNNKFVFIFRNDKYVQEKWGEYWTCEPYITTLNNDTSIFIKNSNSRYQCFDLWIPALDWQYVGPELEISKDTLNSDNALQN